jgi:hypothetical protein
MKSTATPAVFLKTRLQAAVSYLSVLLILANLSSLPAAAQAPPVVIVTVLEGEGAVNNVKSKAAKSPVIEVDDENHRPIAGAAVVFFLPDQGPSGVFMNGSRTLTVTTDPMGRAAAVGIRPNNLNGPMQIRITASFQGQTASAVVNQTNEGGNSSGGGGMSTGTKVAIILLIVGGAAAGGILAATHGGGSSSSSSSSSAPAIVITPGTPTVGAPK